MTMVSPGFAGEDALHGAVGVRGPGEEEDAAGGFDALLRSTKVGLTGEEEDAA